MSTVNRFFFGSFSLDGGGALMQLSVIAGMRVAGFPVIRKTEGVRAWGSPLAQRRSIREKNHAV